MTLTIDWSSFILGMGITFIAEFALLGAFYFFDAGRY